MPKFLSHRWQGQHMAWIIGVLIALMGALMYFEWIIGVIALLFIMVTGYYVWTAEKKFRNELNNYLTMLTFRVKKAGNEVVNELPIGMLLYNDNKVIEWHNPFVGHMVDQKFLIGQMVDELFPDLKGLKEKEPSELHIRSGKRIFRVWIKPAEQLLYFADDTDNITLKRRYEEEKLGIGIVMMDNLDEVTQGLDDQTRSLLNSKVTGAITEWANKNQVYLRRIASDKFLALMDMKGLKKLEHGRFELLDEVRELTLEQKLPLTLSIGIAAGFESLTEVGGMAQTSLDIALGRGGDQVAVKVGQRLSFYGGRSNAVEKRTRVRARVIAHALRDLIKESDKVIIMGHRMPDMDAIGAAIGVLRAVQACQKEAYIVLEGVNPSIQRLMALVQKDEKLNKWFITPEQAMQITTHRTLAVVVDTHKASMVIEPKLLQLTHRIVIVDHHRRGEEFLNEAVLVYMEPYASSTSELVTELLQYIQDRLTLEVLEATALLAGIVVDTKSFAMRTGARTFEAASYLRRNGADSALIQRMLKEDLEEYMKKAEIIKHAEIIHETIALAVTEPNQKYPQLLIAQVADTLLNMTNIMASFVISERPDGLIGISARSLGHINVQLVMERMGGGGHLTNAATQFTGTLADATATLKSVLQQMEQEEGLLT